MTRSTLAIAPLLLLLNTVLGESIRHRELQDTEQEIDGFISINNGPTSSFNLPELDADTATRDNGFRFFATTGFVPKDGTLVCSVSSCSPDNKANVYLYLGEGMVFSSITNKASTLGATCPFSVSLKFKNDHATQGLIVVASQDGDTSGVALSCQSPDVRDPDGDDGSVGGGISSICFSGETTVQVQGKGTILMKDLQINDEVFVGNDSNNNNKPIYQAVYGFGHYQEDRPNEYLQIHTSNSDNKPLEISAAHLLYVKGMHHPIRADTIQTGDVLIQKTVHSSTATSLPVTKIQKVTRNGAYMPLTKDGSIVVNGVLASSYVSIMEDAPEIVGKYLTVASEDQLLHWWLAPYRMVCQGLPTVCQNDKDAEGVAYWLVFGRYLARLANRWGAVSQLLGLALVGLFMAFFMGLEAMVAMFGTIPGAMIGLALAGLTKKVLVGRGIGPEKNCKKD